ncbi:MAG TPA: gamma-glutamyltransferase [Thermoleophilaceae bacterium]|nr:gamma-glutamyltransferase [Thermoleophilaceae bacterium]
MKGVVAAGHPRTAQAGADVLRAGGNAVDAAVAAVLMSFAAESPLTGPGAGGFMLVHTAAGESHLLDFFVAAPGRGLADPRPAPLVPIEVAFSAESIQVFHVGPSSCGVYGTTLGLAEALDRFGTTALGDLTGAAAAAAREGVEVGPMQEFLLSILGPIFRSTPEAAAIYEPGGRPARTGERVKLPELADLLDRLGSEGPDFLYRGDVARAVSDWVLERGGLITRDDLAAYEVVERRPVRARFRGRDVLTNPPPSSGGILIADALELLERLDRPGDVRALAEVIASTNRARDAEFVDGLQSSGYADSFLAPRALDQVSAEIASRLGSTTHLAVIDGDGACATVTCSNGSCSGVVVPGTGVHLNNMLGEEDLNPSGFHNHRPGLRVPSMMSPTVVLADNDVEIALGSAGSNRIRSAIVQTIANVIDGGMDAQAAVDAPRIHVEGDLIDAEPAVDRDALAWLAAHEWRLRQWEDRNLYFGGVQAVARDATDQMSGGGDPRRGGAVEIVAG